uniref:Glycosyltransferase family 2 protein n=1 Tax=Roseihalotalea indica TaxID=2867963 RepID=A0AA49GMD9_9BACT|nr:glycosyltransferase family 2 protein [Tunicatimonas sp. TK19036]
MKSGPLVSIITPVFNRQAYISDAIQSLLKQTYSNWEMIVIDDGSQDDTPIVVKEFSKYDKRIKYKKRIDEPKGAQSCRNIGISHASGKYVIFLDSDDYLASFCLRQRVSFIEEYPNLDFAVFAGLIFNEVPGDNDVLISENRALESHIDTFLNLDAPFLNLNPIWKRKSLIKSSLHWDTDVLAFQDIDFHIAALSKNLIYTTAYQFPPDCFWRKHMGEHIGKSIYHINTVNSHYKLFLKISSELEEAGMLTSRRKQLIFGLFFENVVRQYLMQGMYEKAVEVMKLLEEDKQISKNVKLEGLAYIACFRIYRKLNSEIFIKIVNKAYYLYWPSQTLFKRRYKFCRVRYNDKIVI